MTAYTEPAYVWSCICGEEIDGPCTLSDLLGMAVAFHLDHHRREEHLPSDALALETRYGHDLRWRCPCGQTYVLGRVFHQGSDYLRVYREQCYPHLTTHFAHLCHRCGDTLPDRDGLFAMVDHLFGRRCPRCGARNPH